MKRMGITIFSRSIGLSENVVYKAFKELGWSRPSDYNDLSSEQIEAIKSTKCAETYLSNKAKKEAREKELQQENAELKGQVEVSYEVYNNNLDYSHHIEEQLTEAKEIIEELYNIIPASMADYAKESMEHARKFLTEEADE